MKKAVWSPASRRMATTPKIRYEIEAAAVGSADVRKLTGELESPYLRRAWPSFDALTASGEFARLAEALLRPLFTATFVESSRSRKAAAPAGDQA